MTKGEVRVHNKMLSWKAAKTCGGWRGARNEQQAHQSLQLAQRHGSQGTAWKNACCYIDENNMSSEQNIKSWEIKSVSLKAPLTLKGENMAHKMISIGGGVRHVNQGQL